MSFDMVGKDDMQTTIVSEALRVKETLTHA
jgi:hypothetical protein